MTERQYVDIARPNEAVRTNDRDNIVVQWFRMDRDRYVYDAKLHELGWQQWDTDQDASYFGVWVHPKLRQTFTYAEGDCIQVFCQDAANFRAEILDAERVYGKAPPMAIAYDNDGTRTEYYDNRLKPEDIT